MKFEDEKGFTLERKTRQHMQIAMKTYNLLAFDKNPETEQLENMRLNYESDLKI